MYYNIQLITHIDPSIALKMTLVGPFPMFLLGNCKNHHPLFISFKT